MHSQHCYFLSPALNKPIIYQVESLRDGKSYASRLVKALQDDKPVFILIASYTLPPVDLPPLKGNTISPFGFTPSKQALSHSLRFAHGNASESGTQRPIPTAGGEPDDLNSATGVSAKFEIPFPDCVSPYEECEEEELRWTRFLEEKMEEGSKGRKAVEEYIRVSGSTVLPYTAQISDLAGKKGITSIDRCSQSQRTEGDDCRIWVQQADVMAQTETAVRREARIGSRQGKPSSSSIADSQAMIAYMSDFQYIGVASRSVGLTRISKPRLGMLASLDHATHFYPIPPDFDPSSPILHVMEAAIVDVPSGRGVVRGLIYSQNGVLLAMTSQEGVVRADLGKAERGLVEGRGVGEEDEAKAAVKAKL